MSYKYLIKKNINLYNFGLYPNNSNTVPVIQSNDMKSKEECLKSIYDFKAFMKDNKDSLFKYISVIEDSSSTTGSYNFIIECEELNFQMTRSLKYWNKYEISKAIDRIAKNFDCSIKD